MCRCELLGIGRRANLAISVMRQLALVAPQRALQAKEIAHRVGLAQWQVDSLLVQLRAAGTVRSVRGPKGGYALGASAQEISLADIALAVESDELDSVEQAVAGQGFARCDTKELWRSVRNTLKGYLSEISLATLTSSEIRWTGSEGC